MSSSLGCPNCGTKNNNIASFCRRCGTKLGASNPESYRPSQDGKQKTVVDHNLSGGDSNHRPPPRHKSGTVVDDKLKPERPIKKGTVVDVGLDENTLSKKVVHDDRPVRDYIPSGNSKLVGFIVTYNLNPLGTYFALYQGKTVIGTAADESNITIDWEKDKAISGKHCLLLFRRKLDISDVNSSNGTWVDTATVDKDKHGDLYDGPAEEIFKDAEFRNIRVKLIQIEDEKITLRDNSFFMIGHTLFKVKLIDK